MGSTSVHREPGLSNKEFIERELLSWEDGKYTIVAHNTAPADGYQWRSAFYAAVRNNETGDVFALVVLLAYKPGAYYNCTYKDMDETAHPFYYDASRKVLDALTPTDYESANEWRAKVREKLDAKKARPKVKPGDRIRFPRVFEFTNGESEDTFTVEQYERWTRRGPRKQTVLYTQAGTLVRIPNWRRMDYTLAS